MQNNFIYNQEIIQQIEFLAGDGKRLEQMIKAAAMEPFHQQVVSFLDEFSRELLAQKETRKYPDIVTYAFWIRRASINKLKQRFDKLQSPDYKYLGRGIVFHIAPSNVPINYAYSFTAGLLAGNKNIVKISSKAFSQVDIVNRALEEVLKRYEELRKYLILVRYGHNKEINDYLSSLTDVRVIWGGDATIRELQKSPLPVRAREIAFADRYSVAVIDSDYYLDKCNVEKVAKAFYNDTYLTDQNACTSPKIIFWVGERISKAKGVFWDSLFKLVDREYRIQAVQAVDKLTHMYCLAAVQQCGKSLGFDNRLVRVQIERFDEEVFEQLGNSGYFYEYDCEGILDIMEGIRDKCQTIGYLGDKRMFDLLLEKGIRGGVDRIVPVGQTMDFGLIWDGYDLMAEMTRIVVMG